MIKNESTYSIIFDEWIKLFKFGLFIVLPSLCVLLVLMVANFHFIYCLFGIVLIIIVFGYRSILFKKKCIKHNIQTFFTNKKLILWIRKFSKKDDVYKVQSFVEVIMWPWGTAITLADINIKIGTEKRLIIQNKTLILMFLYFLILFSIAYFFDRTSFLGYIIGIILLFGKYLWRELIKEGNIKVTNNNISKLNIIMDKISNRHLKSNVLRAPKNGELWWEILIKISPSISVVIVDSQDLLMESKNLNKELKHFLETLGTKRLVILTNAQDRDSVLSNYPELRNCLFIKKPQRMGFRPFSIEYRNISLKVAQAILSK